MALVVDEPAGSAAPAEAEATRRRGLTAASRFTAWRDTARQEAAERVASIAAIRAP